MCHLLSFQETFSGKRFICCALTIQYEICSMLGQSRVGGYLIMYSLMTPECLISWLLCTDIQTYSKSHCILFLSLLYILISTLQEYEYSLYNILPTENTI